MHNRSGQLPCILRWLMRCCSLVAMLACLALPMAAVAAAPAASAAKPKAAAAPAKDGRFVIKYTVINKRKYLPIRSVAAYYKLGYTVNAKSRTVKCCNAAGKEVFSFAADSRNFAINGTQAGLSYPVRVNKGEYMLELTDFQDFVDPIMRPGSIPKRKIRTIMLDAGHGGTDMGAQAGGSNEKDLNLSMVKRIGAILTARGFRVLYTRTEDKVLSLEGRSEAAAKQKPDLFVSIHHNAIDEKNWATTSGIEVFVANAKGVPSYGGNVIGQDHPGAKFQSTNSYWAYLTQRALLKGTSASDRGVKRKQFYVVAHATMPAMLVELGFITNAAERKKLLDKNYQDKLAVAVCDGITEIEKALRPQGVPAPVPPMKKPAAPAKAPAAKKK